MILSMTIKNAALSIMTRNTGLLSVLMLIVVMLRAVMLSVVMMSVTYAECH
jgi:hypothetical protein